MTQDEFAEILERQRNTAAFAELLQGQVNAIVTSTAFALKSLLVLYGVLEEQKRVSKGATARVSQGVYKLLEETRSNLKDIEGDTQYLLQGFDETASHFRKAVNMDS